MLHKTCKQQGMNQEIEFSKERSGLQKLKYRDFFHDSPQTVGNLFAKKNLKTRNGTMRTNFVMYFNVHGKYNDRVACFLSTARVP